MGDSAIVAVLAGADCRWGAGGRCLSRIIWGVKIAVSDVRVRTAESGDLARITEIYNHYVLNTPVTFDVEAYTVERREAWFAQFAPTGRHRLLVAEENGVVLGYAGTTRFRPKAAYETTVETTIYCAPEAMGKGIGGQLYSALFELL